MFQVILGQDDHGPFSAQASVNQALGNVARGGPGLGIAHMAPIARTSISKFHPACHEAALWRGGCPVLQAVGHARGEVFELLFGMEVMHAFGTISQGNAAHAEGQRTEFGAAHVMSVSVSGYEAQAFLTLVPALPSRKSRTRCLASGALCAIAAIMASVKKPWSAGCSAMRGRACISA